MIMLSLTVHPAFGALTFGALSATDWFIVPMQGENFAYIGLDEILQCAAKVRRRINPKYQNWHGGAHE